MKLRAGILNLASENLNLCAAFKLHFQFVFVNASLDFAVGTRLVQYGSSSSDFFSNPTILVMSFPSVVSSPSKYLAPGLVGEMETTIALTVAHCLGVLIVLGDALPEVGSTIWRWPALGNNKMLITASVSLDVIVCRRLHVLCSLIMMSPLLTPDALSHLRAIWLSVCNWVSQVSQKQYGSRF